MNRLLYVLQFAANLFQWPELELLLFSMLRHSKRTVLLKSRRHYSLNFQDTTLVIAGSRVTFSELFFQFWYGLLHVQARMSEHDARWIHHPVRQAKCRGEWQAQRSFDWLSLLRRFMLAAPQKSKRKSFPFHWCIYDSENGFSFLLIY